MVNELNNKDYHVIFCGYDKFDHLSFLKNQINERKLSNYFTFFDYLEDEEIIAIYLNSHALVMPTFVGHYSLPLFESFYFKIPAFFTKDLLDESLTKYVYEIDTKIPSDLAKKLLELKSKKNEVENLKKEAYNFYNSFCSLSRIKKTYNDIFEEVIYFKSMWK